MGIDPERHFNQQDRLLTVNAFEYMKFLLYPMLGVRVQAYMAILPVCGVLLLTLLEHRREPMEIFMDRETYWKDSDSYMWGVYFDHHHFAHQLCHRRAHKWGYAGQDITLDAESHGHHWCVSGRQSIGGGRQVCISTTWPW